MSDEQKIFVLASKLTPTAAAILASFGHVSSLAEASSKLVSRLCRDSTMSLVDKQDFNALKQESGESSFDFYLRLLGAMTSRGGLPPTDDDFLDIFVPKLTSVVREKLSVYGAEAASLDKTVNTLKIIDRELFPSSGPSKVLYVKGGFQSAYKPKSAGQAPQTGHAGGATFDGRCHHCQKKGHKRAACRSRIAGHPKIAPFKEGQAEHGGKPRGRGGHRGARGGRGRGRGRGGRGGGKGSNESKEVATNSATAPSSTPSQPSAPRGGARGSGPERSGGSNGRAPAQVNRVGSGAAPLDAATLGLVGDGAEE